MRKLLKRLQGDHYCDTCGTTIPWDSKKTLKIRVGGWPNEWVHFCSAEHTSEYWNK